MKIFYKESIILFSCKKRPIERNNSDLFNDKPNQSAEGLIGMVELIFECLGFRQTI